MKKKNNTGELVINYLASCGKSEVETLELLKAVEPGCQPGDAADEAFGRILPVLTSLESEGLVRLSTDPDPRGGMIPRLIQILPRMKKPADRLMRDKGSGGKAAQKTEENPQRKALRETEAARPENARRTPSVPG